MERSFDWMEVCCRTKKEGGLGLVYSVYKTLLWLVNDSGDSLRDFFMTSSYEDKRESNGYIPT